MSTLIFIKPIDIGGAAVADVFSMIIGGFTQEPILYLDDLMSPLLMSGFYLVDLHASRLDVRVFKWCLDQMSIGVAPKTSALLVPSPKNTLFSNGPGFTWKPVNHNAPPLPMPTTLPNGTSISWNLGIPDDLLRSLKNFDPVDEPACFCKSPSEHAKDCQYIIWKRGRK